MDKINAEMNVAIIEKILWRLRTQIEAASIAYNNPYAVRSEVDRLMAQKDLATWILVEIEEVKDNFK